MNKIITCIDDSAYSDDVCHAGVWACVKVNKPLVLLHAIEKLNQPQSEDLSGAIGLGARSSLLNEMAALDAKRSKIALELGKEMLGRAHKIASDAGCEQVDRVQRHSGIVEAINDLESDACLIVIGRTGEGHPDNYKALGAHIEQIIRTVHTPVLITNKSFIAPESFMLAYDGRETADKAVCRILEGGLLKGMTCHLVSVKSNQKDLEQKFERTQTLFVEHGFDVKASFLEGNIFSSLTQYKEQHPVDMLVMGAFSHSKLASVFLGSNTLKMLEHTQLPLLIMR